MVGFWLVGWLVSLDVYVCMCAGGEIWSMRLGLRVSTSDTASYVLFDACGPDVWMEYMQGDTIWLVGWLTESVLNTERSRGSCSLISAGSMLLLQLYIHLSCRVELYETH